MDPSDAIVTERRFLLDEEVIPGTFVHPKLHTEIVYANHGKHITRNSDGLWLCAFISSRGLEDANYLGLAVSPTAQAVGGDFPEPIWLVGAAHEWYDTLFPAAGGKLSNVCVLVDGEETLHVLYSDASGVWRLRADAAGDDPHSRLSEPAAWTGPEQVAGPGAELGDVTHLPSGQTAVYFVREDALWEQVGDTAHPICERAEHPSVWIDGGGTRHIAFERDRRVYYARSTDGAAWTDAAGNPGAELVAHFCSSWPSIAVTPEGTVVIAYQGEGKIDLKRHRERYNQLRPGGGSTVSYAVHDGERWAIHDLVRSSEIVLKRRVSTNLIVQGLAGRFETHMEEFWRPSLAVDRHGVPWVFWLNTTRRHVYFARFGGETFGDHFEARGPYDCLSRTMFVQKDSRDRPGIGVMTFACNQLYFDHLPVPEYSSAERRRVVFLDNLELAQWSGVDHCLGMWEKHPEPIFGQGISGDSRDDDIAWCAVEQTDVGFEMRYMGQGELRSNAMPGRAFSPEGLRWEKREPFDRDAMTIDGEPFPSSFWRPIFLEDPDEADPDRRYKGLVAEYRYERGIELRCWIVVTSPDALNWRRVPGLPTVLLGDISCGFHLFRDDEDLDPARRYKVSLLMGSNAGRAAVMFTSPDLIHWERKRWLREDPNALASSLAPWPTGPIAIDPDAAESPWEEEVHDAVLWRENGLLMCHYDAFYFHSNQHTNKALALSRDGRHYYRIKRGAANMPHGNCGEWDSGRDRTCIPIRVGDELWLYFCGMPAGGFSDPDDPRTYEIEPGPPSPDENLRHAEVRPWRVGLARLRVDGWAYFRLAREAEQGMLTTIPFDYAGGGLVVNGSGLEPGAVGVEVRRADNSAAVPGFEAEACRFSDSDSVAGRVTWRGDRRLPHGRYRLRFILRDPRAKLYSFGFEQQ